VISLFQAVVDFNIYPLINLSISTLHLMINVTNSLFIILKSLNYFFRNLSFILLKSIKYYLMQITNQIKIKKLNYSLLIYKISNINTLEKKISTAKCILNSMIPKSLDTDMNKINIIIIRKW